MKYLIVLLNLIFVFPASAACVVKSTQGHLHLPETDYLHHILGDLPVCPTNVFEFQTLLKEKNLNIVPAMVANRGFHNPDLGSFSFFESVTGQAATSLVINPGEFFFGHFTDVLHDKIILDQEPLKGKLMIELIVWDFGKKAFNFYEMIGNGSSGEWFYRGDSFDILADVKYLHLIPPVGSPKFGNTLRCSACHTSGGPILKELELPHNDWWTATRPLPFGVNMPGPIVAEQIRNLQNAEAFASLIKKGMNKLEESESYQNAKNSLTLQEQLRPLFCETEINLESDLLASDVLSDKIQIPSHFFINPLLAEKEMKAAKTHYEEMLSQFKMQFPETNLSDADHPWLTPVKGHSDILAIKSLILKQIIDSKFALSVLSVDLENPLVSKTRCDLLKLLAIENKNNWKPLFLKNLQNSPLKGAKILSQLLQTETEQSLKEKAASYLVSAESELKNTEGVKKYFLKLLQTRNSVFSSEISKNPRGQILEPGFRVIFPQAN